MANPTHDPIIIQGPNGPRPRVAVIGCGGTGCNILAEGELAPVMTTIAMGSEPDSMRSLKADRKILADPGRFRAAASISGKAPRMAGSELEAGISKAVKGTDITFILTGLGGLSGGWSSAVAARAVRVSRGTGLCVASMPFSVEGGSRKARAEAQLSAISDSAGATLVIPNDMILAEAPKLPINRAFRVMNSVMVSPVNLFLRSIGSDDIDMVKKHLGAGRMLTMDAAEWDRENAEFAVIESLGRSRWLDIGSGKARAAMLFVEGHCLYDGLNELGRLFSRSLGNDCPVMVASAGERKSGLRVTAVVGS